MIPAVTFAVLLALVAIRLVAPERPPETRLLADTGGPVKTVAVSLVSARRSPLGNAATVSALVNALPPSVGVVALANDPQAFSFVPGARRGQLRLAGLPADRAFTIWPQDPFLVLTGPSGNRLLLSSTFDRVDDALMAEALGAATGLPVERSELMFEGGNVLADERWIFVGANTIRANAERRGETDAEAARRFEAALGGEVLVVGAVPQPVAHIDMMLTPLGDGRLVVADFRAGARVAENALAHAPDAVAAFETGVARLLGERTPGDDPGRFMALGGATARVVETGRDAADYLDALAEALRSRGFEVSRAPILFDSAPPPEPALRPAPLVQRYRGTLSYPVLTYNNVIVEHRDGRDVVYLPQYGLEALDAAGRSAWSALGYDVRPVEGFVMSALHGGALRCATKVIERAPHPSR